MSKLDALRKLIREEIRSAIREELPRLLSENKHVEKDPDYKNKIREQVKKSVTGGIPLTLNEPRRAAPVQFSGNNPLAMLLNETAQNMTPEDMGETREPSVVSSVSDMIGTARKSSNLEMVEIENVPDFSGIMKKLMNK